MNKKKIYTLGYTLFQLGDKIDLELMFNTLSSLGVSYLIDVRSVPFSKQYPECNSSSLKNESKKHGVVYGHMPEIGAKAADMDDVFSAASEIFGEDIFPIPKSNRPEKIELYPSERIVDFSKIRKNKNFLGGISRLENAYSNDYTLALLCSEKNPFDCHRFFLISKALEQRDSDWLEVRHIIENEDGILDTISNEELFKKLQHNILNKKAIQRILQPNFFGPRALDKYNGQSDSEKMDDFCDRYWNLIHGWKKQ